MKRTSNAYYALLEHLPAASSPIGAAASRILMMAMPAWRRTLRQNARLVLGPNAKEDEVRRVAREMLANTQRAIADVLQSQHRTPEELSARVTRFNGQEVYFQARVRSCGMVLASAHMGAFEPCLATLRKFEPRVHVLYQPDPLPRFERARSRLRQRIGVIEHHAQEGVAAWAALREALLANEVVVLHADRALSFQGATRMRFFGSDDAWLPTGPARLALSCGSAIVPTFCYRHPDGLEVFMDTPILCQPQELRAAEVAVHPAQQALLGAMERAISKYPEQWMAFGQILGVRQ